jgi:hypothetical protein
MKTLYRLFVFIGSLGVMIFLSTSLLFASNSGEQKSLGVMISVNGEVSVHRGKGPIEGMEGLLLQPGDSILVKLGANCSGFSPIGQPFELNGPALSVFPDLSQPKTKNWFTTFLSSQIVALVGQSRNQSLISRSAREWQVAADSDLTLFPASEGQVRPSEARFFWQTLGHIDRYQLIIAPAVGDEIKATLHGHKYIQKDLKPGTEYVWKICPVIDGKPTSATWKSFRVMTEEEESKLDESLEDLSPMMSGVLLLLAGLHEEAIYKFDIALASSDSSSAMWWRAKALAEAGLYKQAFEDLSRASASR